MDMDRLAGAWTRIREAAVDFSQQFSSDTSVLLVVGVVTLVVAAVVVRSYGSHGKKKGANLPPGPRNWPVIGALLELGPLFYKTLDSFSAKYGPIVFFRLGVQNLVVVSSPEAAEELLRHRDTEFCDRQTAMNRSSAKYVGLGGLSLSSANYTADYKLKRKLAMAEFFTAARLKSSEDLRTREMAVMVKNIFSSIQSNTNDNAFDNRSSGRNSHDGPTPNVDIRSRAFAAARNVLFVLCVGKRFDSLPPTDEIREFPSILQESAELILHFNVVDYFPWLTWLDPQGVVKRMKAFEKRQRAYYKSIVERSRQELSSKLRKSSVSNDIDEGSSNSFLHALLQAQGKGTKITDDCVGVEVKEMLSGGITTTGTEVSWALLELVRHPKVLQRLQQELDAVVGKGRPLEEADQQSMPFLNAVILETLRLHGVLAHTFAHVNMKPSTLCGYDIPANTAVLVNMWSMGRDPKIWKDPLQFNPDRFIAGAGSSSPRTASDSETIRAGGNCYFLLPFSSGRRMCPGYSLARILLWRMVGTLVHAFDWSPPHGRSPEDMIEASGAFLLWPASSLLVPTPRLLPHVYKSNIS